MHYLLDLDPWQVDIMRVERATWVCVPVLTVPWLTADRRFGATSTIAGSLSGALLQVRQRLADPGFSLQEIQLRLQTDVDRATQRFHPLQQYIECRAWRFGLVVTVECLPTGIERKVAMALVEGGFDGTSQQLLVAARAIAV